MGMMCLLFFNKHLFSCEPPPRSLPPPNPKPKPKPKPSTTHHHHHPLLPQHHHALPTHCHALPQHHHALPRTTDYPRTTTHYHYHALPRTTHCRCTTVPRPHARTTKKTNTKHQIKNQVGSPGDRGRAAANTSPLGPHGRVAGPRPREAGSRHGLQKTKNTARSAACLELAAGSSSSSASRGYWRAPCARFPRIFYLPC
jgi:hypothetical protein